MKDIEYNVEQADTWNGFNAIFMMRVMA